LRILILPLQLLLTNVKPSSKSYAADDVISDSVRFARYDREYSTHGKKKDTKNERQGSNKVRQKGNESAS